MKITNEQNSSEHRKGVYVRNRRAFHDYHILESLEVGIQLFGHEVKSIRDGRVDLSKSFARIQNGEVFLINVHIPPYQGARISEYDPYRTRKLLLHRDQINSLIGKIPTHNAVLVPLSIYDKNNLIKISLGLVKSKKQFDKRKVIKERDQLRRIEQELRGKE